MLFSVVVPVYNVEPFVHKCLDSLVNQTYREFEIIIVNDGSKDNSLSICEEFANTDNRIKIISQENKGLAIARRVGAFKAKGEYIVNVDSDDWCELNYLEELASIINEEGRPDLVCVNHFENDTEFYNPNFNNILLCKKEIEETIYPYLIRNKRYEYFIPTAWAKAFKRELYQRNTCTTRIQVGEDGSVIIPVVLQCENIYLSSKHLYHYRITDGSMIQVKKPRSYSDIHNVYDHLKKTMGEDFDKFHLQISRFISHLAFNCSVTQFYSEKKYKEVKAIILENLANPIIANAIKEIDSAGFKGNLMAFSLKHRSIFLMKLYSRIM